MAEEEEGWLSGADSSCGFLGRGPWPDCKASGKVGNGVGGVLAGMSKGKKIGFVQCPGGQGEVGSKRGGFLLR